MDQEALIDKNEGLLLSGIQTQWKGRTAWRSFGFGVALLNIILFSSIALNVLLLIKETSHTVLPEKTRFGSPLPLQNLLTLPLLIF